VTAKIHHVGIAVPNLERAAEFFREVFGVEPRAVQVEGVRNLYMVFANLEIQICEDSARLGDAPFGRLEHIAIQVDDLDDTADRLAAHGVKLTSPEHTEVRQYRNNFTTEDGGVGVMFQLIDERAGK
jgi:catechol 2,3-dioxygenase-like lactoylglutathione lyase family enzyme